LRSGRVRLYPAATMTKTQTTIGAGTKIVGSLETDGDLVVDGHLEGGPLRVAGRLLVGRTGAVSCEDTEVGDALVVGLYSGTLKAREVVRIHQSGRLLGEVMAARVTFVSDAQLSGLLGGRPPKRARRHRPTLLPRLRRLLGPRRRAARHRR
jgi:cytoskeletal protein CcmA (bactofilin family)